MHIFTSAYKLVTKDGVVFQPGVRYVLPSHIARDVEAALVKEYGEHPDYRLSHFNSYERRYAGRTLGAGESLSIYRHGAIGDTLMTTALVAELRRRNPAANITIYTRPGNVDLWHGLGVNVVGGYPVFDEIRHGWHLFYENMLECDSEPDQRCSIDNLFQFAGIDPASVPDDRKIPVVIPDPALDGSDVPSDYRYIYVQDGASNANRDWPWTDSLVSKLSDIGWGSIIGGEKYKFPRFRQVIPWVKHASLVICPDSSIGHLAAAFPHVPVISLWGLFHPNDRIRYYRNHHPIFGFSACPHAPCRSHQFVLPHWCKDAPSFDGKCCAALASITPEMVVAKAKELLCVS